MRIIPFLLSTLLAMPFLSKAQNTFDTDGGCLNIVDFMIGQPMGNYSDGCYATAYLHEIFINERFTIGAGIGYSYHDKYQYSAIPIFLSSHYFFLNKRFSPYANFRIGAYGMFGKKSVDTFEKFSVAGQEYDQVFNFYFSPTIGIKAHISQYIGVTASVSDEAYLVKGFDVKHNDYRSKLTHSLGINIGICFQIKGW